MTNQPLAKILNHCRSDTWPIILAIACLSRPNGGGEGGGGCGRGVKITLWLWVWWENGQGVTHAPTRQTILTTAPSKFPTQTPLTLCCCSQPLISSHVLLLWPSAIIVSRLIILMESFFVFLENEFNSDLNQHYLD